MRERRRREKRPGGSRFCATPGNRPLTVQYRESVILIETNVLVYALGGLSGHQGALRSAFLTKVRLEKEAFIGTNSVIALIVDVVRLVVYGVSFFGQHLVAVGAGNGLKLVASAVAAAFLGSLVGARLLKNRKITIQSVRYLIGAMLMLLGIALGMGMV
uniref:Uncharacterized protein n=1 Tax=Ammonifex degensii TaxID=42838 RepID=A0A7C2E269_9THEO